MMADLRKKHGWKKSGVMTMLDDRQERICAESARIESVRRLIGTGCTIEQIRQRGIKVTEIEYYRFGGKRC